VALLEGAQGGAQRFQAVPHGFAVVGALLGGEDSAGMPR